MDGKDEHHIQLLALEFMDRQCARARAMGETRVAAAFKYAIEELVEHKNADPACVIQQLKRFPVTIDEFVESPDFLGRLVTVWPALFDDLRRLNPDVFLGAAPIHEAYLGGATGIGKSTLAIITTLFQIYLLSCLRDPQTLFGLAPQTRLVTPLQSVNPGATLRVLYEPFRQIFEAMPFARKYLLWNRNRTASLELEGGIHIVPLQAGADKLLGQAIPGAIVDEANFMRAVEHSVRVAGPRGLGGLYDPPEELHSELTQRRKSRFQGAPISLGTLIFSSSALYNGDFLDRRIAELQAGDHPNVFWSRHKRYDVVPSGRYSGESFVLLLGNERHRTRPLDDDDEIPEDSEIEIVPIEYLDDFHRNPEAALRNILGLGSDSLNPFINRRETINDAIVDGAELGLEPWTEESEIDLARDGWPRFNEDAMPQDRGAPRFVHVDLSLLRDACGIAVVKFTGIKRVEGDGGLVEVKRHFAVELALAIRPSPAAEIEMGEVRDFIAELVTRHRLNIVTVSSDSYRGADFRQALRSLSVRTEEISLDADPVPYETLRTYLSEGRLALVESPVLERELLELERDRETGRIDHPPRGSKDVSDAVAGALSAAISSAHVHGHNRFVDSDGYRFERPRPNMPRPRGNRRR